MDEETTRPTCDHENITSSTRSSCDKDRATSPIVQDRSAVVLSEVSAYHGHTDLNNKNNYINYCNCGTCGVDCSGCDLQTGIKTNQSGVDNENQCISAKESLDSGSLGFIETYKNTEDSEVLRKLSEGVRTKKEESLNAKSSPGGFLLKRSLSCVAKITTTPSNASCDEVVTKNISESSDDSTRNSTSRRVSTCSSAGTKKTISDSSTDSVADIFKNSTRVGVLSARRSSHSVGTKKTISDSSSDDVALYKNGNDGGELYQDGGYVEEDFEDDDEVFQRSFRRRRVLSCFSLDLATSRDKVRLRGLAYLKSL